MLVLGSEGSCRQWTLQTQRDRTCPLRASDLGQHHIMSQPRYVIVRDSPNCGWGWPFGREYLMCTKQPEMTKSKHWHFGRACSCAFRLSALGSGVKGVDSGRSSPARLGQSSAQELPCQHWFSSEKPQRASAHPCLWNAEKDQGRHCVGAEPQ